jgi:Zn-finger protein
MATGGVWKVNDTIRIHEDGRDSCIYASMVDISKWVTHTKQRCAKLTFKKNENRGQRYPAAD